MKWHHCFEQEITCSPLGRWNRHYLLRQVYLRSWRKIWTHPSPKVLCRIINTFLNIYAQITHFFLHLYMHVNWRQTAFLIRSWCLHQLHSYFLGLYWTITSTIVNGTRWLDLNKNLNVRSFHRRSLASILNVRLQKLSLAIGSLLSTTALHGPGKRCCGERLTYKMTCYVVT